LHLQANLQQNLSFGLHGHHMPYTTPVRMQGPEVYDLKEVYDVKKAILGSQQSFRSFPNPRGSAVSGPNAL